MFGFVCTRVSVPTFLIALLTVMVFLSGLQADGAVRIKDITTIHNEDEIDLIGYGLVIGLDGTGDGKGAQFTMQSLSNMMERMGLTVETKKLKVKNVAAVMVTGRLSSNNTKGSRIDVTVSSIGDASSLQGGTLLITPLSSANGKVYAIAQGPVSIGGFNVQVDEGNKIINNYTLVGRVPGGGKVTRTLERSTDNGDVLLFLHSPDYTTATRIAERINNKYGMTAYVDDVATIRIKIPDSLAYYNERMHFISDIGTMRIQPDERAKIVINERTGTIVAGQYVTIAPVAIAHGNITVSIKSFPVISQPEPFSQGETVVTDEYQIQVDEEPSRVVYMEEVVSLADVANALNMIGASPIDIIAIFQAMKQSGALRAEFVII
ncbi:MAG TPA: flagellar basal body P-ring protein FlgI [candidate division Zixibacteria bacterium]|nr:flagellar basal body P-ring protein FlgI [candidate division Zixibacteria bacterium]